MGYKALLIKMLDKLDNEKYICYVYQLIKTFLD